MPERRTIDAELFACVASPDAPTLRMPDLHVAPAPARRPRYPTAREAEALAYLAASERPVSAEDLGRDLAFGDEPRGAHACCARGNSIIYQLASLDLVTMPKSSRFALTERGRIAAALVMIKHPGLREAFFDFWEDSDG